MYSVCLRFTANPEDAKDALQEGFIAVFTGLKTYRAESKIGGWIRTIMVRTSIRIVKKQKMFFTETTNYHDSITWDSNLNGEFLHKAIMKLSSGYRTVFLLYEVEGYNHSEIAVMLKISEGTSKSQLYHAKRRLRKYILKMDNYGI